MRTTPTQPEPDGEDPPETGPLRRCLVLREPAEKKFMLRFVASPEGSVVFDVSGKLPGRGMWLTASSDILAQAAKKNVFARAAKKSLRVPPDLAAQVEASLKRRVVERIGLARRSGQAVAGFEKAREWIIQGKAALAVHAVDGSVEERLRLLGGRDIAVVSVLGSAELGRIFGRERAVHVAIAAGGLAQTIQIEVLRLAGVAGANVSGQ